mgnify:CR=1 FL=1
MVMVKKASVKKSGSKAFFTKYWPVLLFVIILLAAGGVYGYNKYLDRQNVADMKQLLADFEKLKTDIESETGEKLYIEASCGSVGKFATSYACTIYLKNDLNKLYAYSDYTPAESSLLNTDNRCRVIQSKDAKYLNFYSCVLHIRASNIDKAEATFFKYDTSPGSPV